MYGDAVRIHNLEDLRRYILETICRHNELEPDYFLFTERLLTRRGKPCGIFFCLHGPRSTKFTAIWEMEKNSVLFYGSTGQRWYRTQLAARPQLEAGAA